MIYVSAIRQRMHVHNMLRNSNIGLVAGSLLGLIMANVAYDLYHDLTPHVMHFIVFEVLFSLFFGMAMKEVWEQCFAGDKDAGEKDGIFYNPNTRYLVGMMTLGGIFGPTALFFIGYFLGMDVPWQAFVVVTATDIAFSAAMAKVIFKTTDHPAVQLLLGLAIADDLAGMLMIAAFYGEGLLRIEVLYGILIIAVAIALTGVVMRRWLKLKHYAWYAVPGALSMFGLHEAGMHMALAFVFIVPFMPHGKRDPLIFHELKIYHTSLGIKFRDTLNRAEHDLQPVITLTLFLFAFMAAGIRIDGVGLLSPFIVGCLIPGKALGIFIASTIARRIPDFWPREVSFHMSNTVGILAGAGFTVSLFVAELAFEGAQHEAAAIGALASLSAIFIAYGYARVTGVIRQVSESSAPSLAEAQHIISDGFSHQPGSALVLPERTRSRKHSDSRW